MVVISSAAAGSRAWERTSPKIGGRQGRGVGRDVVAADVGQPVQGDPEDQHQDHGHPEVRDRGGDHEHGRQDVVQPAAAAPGGQDAEAGAQHEGQQRGHADQADRPPDRAADDRADRRRVEGHRRPEVAGEHVVQVGDVLLPQARVGVDPEQDVQRLQRLRVQLPVELGHHRERGVARHQPREQEVDGQRYPQREQEEAEAAERESHARLLAVMPGSCWEMSYPGCVPGGLGPRARAAVTSAGGAAAPAPCRGRRRRPAGRRGCPASATR